MKLTIIKKLNQLNKQFYQTIASDFDASRQYAWSGWQQLTLHLQQLIKNHQQKIKILDLGCGNGRFALFLNKQLSKKFHYFGIDSNEQLLKIAKHQAINNSIEAKFKKTDIISTLINQSINFNEHYDLIVAFGLMHHVPSYDLRKQLLCQLKKMLNKNGLIIISCWQFANDERFKNRIIDPQTLIIDKNDLEEDDYILDWRQGKKAYRYCHYLSEQEAKQLAKDNDLKIVDDFYADGKSDRLNYYLVMEE